MFDVKNIELPIISFGCLFDESIRSSLKPSPPFVLTSAYKTFKHSTSIIVMHEMSICKEHGEKTRSY